MNTGERGAELWPLVATLGAAATATNGVPPVLHDVLRQLGTLCAAEVELWESVADRDAGAQRWQVRDGRGGEPARAIGHTGRAPADPVAQAARTLRTVPAPGPLAALAIPILAFGRLQGVLHLRAGGAEADLAGWRAELERFAPVLGLYLHAAELNEALASGALRDRLTGIASQAQLHEHLERELAQARRSQRGFALLLVAVDRFESLGVELGLPLRDRVVRSLAAMLRDACRNGDIIGRYGADRFLVLLPDTTSQGAHLAAQRYLAHFYRRPIALPEGAQLYLDVSIGIGLFPVDGATIGELVECTTTALREAQRLGGMRAVAA